jgi:hypothetical protein
MQRPDGSGTMMAADVAALVALNRAYRRPSHPAEDYVSLLA